jgi:hypothetical protein
MIKAVQTALKNEIQITRYRRAIDNRPYSCKECFCFTSGFGVPLKGSQQTNCVVGAIINRPYIRDQNAAGVHIEKPAFR